MKKYITLATFLAASATFVNAAPLVGDSALVHIGGDYSIVSAWDAVYGKTAEEIKNTASGSISAAADESFAAGLSGATVADPSAAQWKLIDYTFGYLFRSSGKYDSEATYFLKSIQFITRSDGAEQLSPLTLSVYDSSGNVVATSSTVSYEAKEANVYGAATATFSGEVAFDLLSAYTIGFNAGSSSQEGVGVFMASSDSASDYYQIDGSSFYMPVIRITLDTIPEPSAFGLLAGIGALALVAARRRRNERRA